MAASATGRAIRWSGACVVPPTAACWTACRAARPGRSSDARCSAAASSPGPGSTRPQIIHFGASYQAIEYEWSLWVEQFEALLRRLYWASAVVHLETEVNGSHTFRWESERGFHTPQESDLQVRCAWEREGGRR